MENGTLDLTFSSCLERKGGYYKKYSLKPSVESPKWYIYGIVATTPFGSCIFKSVVG